MSEIIHLSHMPSDLVLYASLYKDVENAAFLKQQLLAANTEFEYAFIDANMVVSRKHVLAAAFRAMNDYLNDRLKSKNVHSEILFCLSPNSNIGEAFRRFGVQDTTRNLLVLKVATDPEVMQGRVTRHLEEHVKGTEVPFDDEEVSKVSDLNRIRKTYKLGAIVSQSKGPGNVNGVANDEANVRAEMEVQILGLMALRGAT